MTLLKDKLAGRRLILASHSPRRRELMAGAGFDFMLADGYEVEETYPATLEAARVPEYLSRLKSHSYPVPLGEDDVLITADGSRFLGQKHIPLTVDEVESIMNE